MKYVMLIILLLMCACADPFSARNSAPPLTDRGTFIQPATPQIVLLNLENSYKELIITNFLHCLDSSFFFRYDFTFNPTGGQDSGWTYADESRLTEKMFNNLILDSSLKIDLKLRTLTNQYDQIFDSNAVLYRSYSLNLISSTADSAVDSTTFLGTAIFTMSEDEQGLWSIVRWEDQHQEINHPSWADYKNGFR